MPDSAAALMVKDRSTASVRVKPGERLLTRTRPVATVPSPEDDPTTIGRYAIRGRLGLGGMGVVYEALDTALDRPVALKLMLVDDGAESARLRREAQALARLSHPNVVEVFEIGEHQGRPFVAMALVEGHTLGRWLELRRRSTREILDAFVRAGEGLAAAHAEGLVHRDFKPSNVLVGLDGRICVVDFGLVRDSGVEEVAGSDQAEPRAQPSSSSGEAWSEPLTKNGSMVGTPAYMPPEVLSNMPAGPAGDQYSFCASLFEALFGHHPFVEGDEWSELPYNVLAGRLQRPTGLDREGRAVLRVLERGLRLRPEDRFESMPALLEQLRSLPRRRTSWPSVLAGGGVALLLAGMLVTQPTRTSVPSGPCDRARVAMQTVWTTSRRQGLRDAWRREGTKASDAWERTDARLVAFADAWWSTHRSACEPPRSAAADEIAACLSRQARGLDAKLEVLAMPDDALVETSVQMVGQLEDPARCEQGWRASAMAEPSDSPHAADLDQIEALFLAGRYEQVAPLIESLVVETELEGSPQSRSAAKLWLGRLYATRGEPGLAGEALEDSYLLAKQSGLDWRAAAAALDLLKLFGGHYYRPVEAERWSGHAKAEVERLGDQALLASYLNAQGRSLRWAGDLEGALEHHQRALEIQREILPDDHLDLATSLFHVGTVLGLRGQVSEGRAALEESLRIRRAQLGTHHPAVTQPLTNLGVFLQNEGRLDEAREVYEEVLSIMEAVMPNNPLARRVPLTNLSGIHARLGDDEQAAAALERYLQGFVSAGQEADELTRETLSCEIAVLRAEYEEAVRRCRRAVAVEEQRLGADHLQVAYWTAKLAESLGRLGRVDEALTTYERVVELCEGSAVETDATPVALMTASALEVGRGRVQAGLELLERASEAVPVHMEPPGRFLGLVTELAVVRAALRVELEGPRPELLAELREGVATYEELGGLHEDGLLHASVLLAGAERRAGNLEAALVAAERAVALGEAPTRRRALRGRARFELAQCLDAAAPASRRARELALLARDDLPSRDGFVARDRARIDAWLRERGWLDQPTPEP